MTVIEKPILVFTDIDHKLDILLQKGRLCPIIEVKDIELTSYDFFTKSFNGEISVSYKSAPEEHSPEVLLYKHNGKYVVLNGSDTVLKQIQAKDFNGKITGRYVSSIVLKSTRIPERVETPEVDTRRFANIRGDSNRFDNGKHDRRPRW
jgi:hypothetical protein